MDWDADGPAAQGRFTTVAIGEHARYGCVADVEEDSGLLTFYVHSPNSVPAKIRSAAAEFLTRANYGMRIGNFEMDFDDGEVRFKTQTLGDGVTLAPGLIGVLVSAGVAAMDAYYPGLMKVIYGRVSPAAAIEEIEGPGSDL